MARISTRFPIKSISGRFGRTVFITQNGETRAYPYRAYRNPRSEAQQARRGLFADAVRSWQTLSDGEKREWNRTARQKRKKLRKSCRGYHLYLSTVLYGETAPVVTGTAVFPPRSPLYLLKNRLRQSSVTAALSLRKLFGTASDPLKEPFFMPPGRKKAA